MATNETTLELNSLQKDYGTNRALSPLTLSLSGSRIHALIGKNGSGKSTLIKIIAGAIQPTAGQVLLNGIPLNFDSPQDALDAGIVTVHQELSLIPELTVAENIFLGRMPKSHGFIQWSTLNKKARDLLDKMGAKDINVTARVSTLSVGRQQVVEIAKAMSFSPRVLQLDEPTSALAQEEVEHLFALLRRLRDSGVLLIYVSHRLSELAEIADDVLVLRDGEFIGAIDIEAATSKKIVDMMFGQIDEFLRRDKRATSTEVVLEVQDLSIDGVLDHVSFKLHKGEVLGIAGMLGSGRTELLRGVFGADPIDTGRIFVDGKRVQNLTPQTMRDLGVGYTSEDRKIKGLVQSLSCHANLCMAGLRRMARWGWISKRSESPFVNKQIEDLRIKLENPAHLVSSLSGGNQQKIVLGNWLNISPRVIMFDEPSRGVDVQAKQQIFKMMWELSKSGLAAIVVSTELEELPTVCDRILVLKKGKFAHEFGPEIGAKALYEACMVEQAD
jgi:ABC-type sugar transport system ATPase subunit